MIDPDHDANELPFSFIILPIVLFGLLLWIIAQL